MPLDAARDAVITVQARVVEMRAAENARLAGQVADLAAGAERLERLASRNSKNSSFPPLMDDQPGRTPPPARPKRGKGKGRNPGKLPGASGSAPGLEREPPGRTVPHFPQGTCACGADLARAADLGAAASHQEIEIPLMTAAVIQHDVHEVACGCGRVHRAAAPDGAGAAGTVTYGGEPAGLVCVPDSRARHRCTAARS